MSSRVLGFRSGKAWLVLAAAWSAVACSGGGSNEFATGGFGTGGSGATGTGSGGSGAGGGGVESGGTPSTGATGALSGTGATASGGSETVGNPLTRGQTMNCETVTPGAEALRIEAECAHGVGCPSGVTGGQSGTQLENGNSTVGFMEEGDWLQFDGVTLDGITNLELSYAKEVAGGQVEVRIDSPTGTLLGSQSLATTGGWNTWQQTNISLDGAAGTHALYLVTTGSNEGIANLDFLHLSGGASSGGTASAFHLNHLGFATLGPKHAVVEGSPGLDRFHVVNASGQSVWCGDLVGQSFSAWGSNSTFYSVDFTELTEPGTYRLQVGGSTSEAFEVGDAHLFEATFGNVLGYFNGARADDPNVWSADQAVPFTGGSGTRDVRGGWYDASGDISKYLTHLSYANYMNPQQIPLVAWALAWVSDAGEQLLTASGHAEAVRNEALWGADYLLRVLDPGGYFYINVFDGWSGDVGSRSICAFVGENGSRTGDYQSAMREGGGMSIAALARIANWGRDGDFASTEYLAGAKAAFAHLDTSGAQYADDGIENVIDDYTGLLAASELFGATDDTTYLEAARRRAASLIGRLAPSGYFIADGGSRPFWHGSDAGLPVVALARYVEVETDPAQRSTAQTAIRTHLDYLQDVTSEVVNPYGYARQHTSNGTASFFMPHENETGYWWQGENARLGSLAAAAMLGAGAIGATGSEYLDLLRFAGHQVDWVLGNNPYDVCFLRGAGRNNPPPYSGEKPEVGSLTGGIANGITSDGSSGIAWMAGGEDWQQWRWVEQWLPHAAWYIVAITAMER